MVYRYNFDLVQPGAHQKVINSKYKENFDILVEYLSNYDKKHNDNEESLQKRTLNNLINIKPPLNDTQKATIYKGLALLLHPDKYDLSLSTRSTPKTAETLFKMINNLLQENDMLTILQSSLQTLRNKGEKSITIESNPLPKTQPQKPKAQPTQFTQAEATKKKFVPPKEQEHNRKLSPEEYLKYLKKKQLVREMYLKHWAYEQRKRFERHQRAAHIKKPQPNDIKIDPIIEAIQLSCNNITSVYQKLHFSGDLRYRKRCCEDISKHYNNISYYYKLLQQTPTIPRSQFNQINNTIFTIMPLYQQSLILLNITNTAIQMMEEQNKIQLSYTKDGTINKSSYDRTLELYESLLIQLENSPENLKALFKQPDLQQGLINLKNIATKTIDFYNELKQMQQPKKMKPDRQKPIPRRW